MLTFEQHIELTNKFKYKSGGDGSTPILCFKEMIKDIDEDILKDPNKKYLDCAAGTGTSLMVLYYKLIKYHSHEHIINNQLYACDINIICCKVLTKKLGLKNVYNVDFLTYNFKNMKFDVIIGNPPYNDESSRQLEGSRTKGGRSMAKEFFEKSIKVSTPNAYIALLGPYAKLQSKNIMDYMRSKGLYLITECKDYFKGTLSYKGSIGAFYFNRSEPNINLNDQIQGGFEIPTNNLGQIFISANKSICRKDFEHLLHPQGNTKVFITTVKIGFTNDEELINKISDSARGYWRVILGYNGDSIPKIGRCEIASPNDIVGPSCISLKVNSEQEAKILSDYLKSNDCKELLAKTRKAITNSKRQFAYIPNPLM